MLSSFLSISKTFPNLTTCNFSQKNDKNHPLKLFLQKTVLFHQCEVNTNHDFASFSYCKFFVLNASVLKCVGFCIFWHFEQRLCLTKEEFQLRNKSKKKVLLVHLNIFFKYIQQQIKYVIKVIRFVLQNIYGN